MTQLQIFLGSVALAFALGGFIGWKATDTYRDGKDAIAIVNAQKKADAAVVSANEELAKAQSENLLLEQKQRELERDNKNNPCKLSPSDADRLR